MRAFTFIAVWRKIIWTYYSSNMTAAYVKMLYYNKIDVLEGINVNKSNKS